MNSTKAGRLEGYESARGGLGYYVWENPGTLLIGGPDRRAFLQRQTTNDIKLLDFGQAVTTVLTTPAARILDVLTVSEESELLRAITLPGRGDSTLRYLRGRIFFMDKVSVEDARGQVLQVELVGPGLPFLGSHSAEKSGRQSGRQQADARAAAEAGKAGQNVEDFGAQLLSLRNLGRLLLCPQERADDLLAALEEAGGVRLPFETLDVLRVESGILSGRHELSDEYTPLEVGLDWAVSGDKGCYTGQEVIARQITYDKVTRRLAGLRLDHPAEANQGIFSADEGRPIGIITSAVLSPRLGPIALAVMRRPYNEAGSKVRVGDSDGVPATVESLPFSP